MTGPLIAAAIALALTLAAGLAVVPRLARFGQPIREDAPARHRQKAGTPTMGGVLILLGLVVGSLAGGAWPRGLLPIGLGLAFGAVGLADDLRKVARGRNLGLRGREKLAALVALSLIAGASVVVARGGALAIPGTDVAVPLGWWYLVLAVVVAGGFANGVNFTDGLDGLAAGTTAITLAASAVVSLWRGDAGVASACAAAAGACAGFLWYNRHPARVIMGDVGSLAIGGVLAGAAMATGTELLLVVLGAVYVAETLSVMLQVAYFRLTGGRRIFRMSPLHHHFELSGWSETQVVTRFWIASALAAAAGLAIAVRG